MAVNYHSTPEKLAEIVTTHINDSFKDALKIKLRAQAEPIIEQIAQEWADALEAKVFAAESFGRDSFEHEVKVALMINRREVPRRGSKPE